MLPAFVFLKIVFFLMRLLKQMGHIFPGMEFDSMSLRQLLDVALIVWP